VHRDFKPGNAIIDDEGRPRVLDFGLARKADEGDDPPSIIERVRTDPHQAVPLDESLTKTGAVLGTPAYMPPEQMMGREADARSDQFSFCVSLYEALYGERPLQGSTMAALMVAVRSGKVEPAPKGSKVPAKLRAVLLRGLAVEPAQRWTSMNDPTTRSSPFRAPPGDHWYRGNPSASGRACCPPALAGPPGSLSSPARPR
jgi:serine/threonine protein kinase